MTLQRVRRSNWGGLLFAAVLGLCLGAGEARAQLSSTAVASGAPDEGNDRVEAALLTDVAQVKAGDAFRVGVRFRMDPGWHIYWKNPGESGLASEVTWDTPGTTVGAQQWPAPSTFRTSDGYITTYGYADEVLLFADARASEKAEGSLQLSAAADVLVCEVHCLPAQLMLTRNLPVGPETQSDPAHAPGFDAARARVPVSPESSGHEVTLALDTRPLTAGKPFTGTLTVTAPRGQPVPAVEKDFFVPERIPGIARLALSPVAGRPGTFKLEGEAAPDVPAQEPRFAGVLRLGSASAGATALTLSLPLASVVAAAPGAPAASATKAVDAPKPAVVAPAGAAESSLSLGLVLLFAFLGGALLNLMPCVFPVLALKAYGFTRTVHAEQGKVGLHALAYAGGIVGSLMVLAGVVLALRAGGSSVGWGFQFQEPLFVAAVAAVLVAFALNLFGVFHVGTDGTALVEKVDSSHGFSRSAGEGVLAVVLATPCSAPLLGTAVGFALAAGPLTVLATFFMLGLGLALPFCLLVLVPGLRKFLPKPGAWMERGKQLLGFALLGTTVWLVWVMGGLTGVDGMARLLAFLAVVGLGAWLYGLVQGASGGRKAAGVAAVVAVLVVGGVFSLRFEETGPAVRKSSMVAEAQPWDEAAVAAALKAGQPVFIDFTADWCLTCKFNERTVLTREDVRAAFSQHKVAFFVADWTRRDERISAKLAEFGRAGVPMYLVVSPAAPDKPEVLPELLTSDSVTDAVRRAAERVADAT
ncbi:protein-disulfide reductase DsbD family protein [Archangium lansingense]|uniref:Thioredoxin family protein n=1 Tax=Archangium lansingense TaxID=2995310 RepID=A0ABT3ZW15_9BACT|nr:thioredoxin family protein [Archangium lansinium]MCY1073281.1 thioredoxin family protein [Archangium lansinium]